MAIAGVILIALLLDAVTDANRVSVWKDRIENFVSGEEDIGRRLPGQPG